MNKIIKIYNNILCEINYPIVENNEFKFLNYIKSIIKEDYNIFPVPKLLLDDIINFVKNKIINDDLTHNEKHYKFNDILNTFVNNWKLYHEFKENVDIMIKQNSSCSLVVCLFDDINTVKNILNKYKNTQLKADEIFNSFASIYSYGNDKNFNACLCINVLNVSNNLRMTIQHELIHWMQISLNSKTNKSHGLFNSKKFNLTNKQLNDLTSITKDNKESFIKKFEYVLSGYEFEAWVANACEEFENSKYDIKMFINIITNDKLFKEEYLFGSIENRELLLFSRICYLSSLNDKSDDRYWYLIEALKENKNYV